MTDTETPTALRDQYAAAIASYDHAVGQATDPAPGDHHHGQADAVMTVRDGELEQLRQRLVLADQIHQENVATIDRVRAECDRIEAAVRANPQAPDFDGAYLAAIGHIRAAIDPQQGICIRCHCPAGSPDCQHCNCCDVPDQPLTALREQYAAAIDADLEQFFRDHPEEPRNSPWVYGMRDAAAAVRAADAVRDRELEQLRAERDRWRQRAEKRAARYEEIEAADQRVRDLHEPVQHMGQTWCGECSVRRSTGPRTEEWVALIPHPCATISALDPTEQS